MRPKYSTTPDADLAPPPPDDGPELWPARAPRAPRVPSRNQGAVPLLVGVSPYVGSAGDGTGGFDPLVDFIAYLIAVKAPHPKRDVAPHLYASDAGRCLRQTYYRFTADEPPEEDVEPSTEIVRAIGTYLHDTYMEMLKTHFPTVSGEVRWAYPDDLHPVMTGRADGVYRRPDPHDPTREVSVALEVKSKSKFQYSQVLAQNSPFLDNALQGAMSGYVLKTDYVEVVYIARDWVAPNDPVVSFLYETPTEAAVKELRRLRTGVSGPKVAPREVAGELVHDPVRDRRCMFCRFKDDCVIDGES